MMGNITVFAGHFYVPRALLWVILFLVRFTEYSFLPFCNHFRLLIMSGNKGL